AVTGDGEGADHLDRRLERRGVEAALEALGQLHPREGEDRGTVIRAGNLEAGRAAELDLDPAAARGLDEAEVQHLGRGLTAVGGDGGTGTRRGHHPLAV